MQGRARNTCWVVGIFIVLLMSECFGGGTFGRWGLISGDWIKTKDSVKSSNGTIAPLSESGANIKSTGEVRLFSNFSKKDSAFILLFRWTNPKGLTGSGYAVRFGLRDISLSWISGDITDPKAADVLKAAKTTISKYQWVKWLILTEGDSIRVQLSVPGWEKIDWQVTAKDSADVGQTVMIVVKDVPAEVRDLEIRSAGSGLADQSAVDMMKSVPPPEVDRAYARRFKPMMRLPFDSPRTVRKSGGKIEGIEFVSGVKGRALYLAESGQHVQYDASLPSIAGLIELWIRPGSTPSDGCVFKAWGSESLVFICVRRGISFSVFPPGAKDWITLTADVPLTPGEWLLVAGEWCPRGLILYINGDAVAEKAVPLPTGLDCRSFSIGRDMYPGSRGGATVGATDVAVDELTICTPRR